MSKLYGIDLEKPTTPEAARDALIQCFVGAHDSILEEMSEFTDEPLTAGTKELAVKTLVKKFFAQHNGNFDHPTRQDLVNACNALKEFSAHFRDQSVIAEHYKEMQQIINLIPKEA